MRRGSRGGRDAGGEADHGAEDESRRSTADKFRSVVMYELHSFRNTRTHSRNIFEI